MSNPKVLDALRRIEAQIVSKQYQHGLLRMADAVCVALRIPEGCEWVLLIQNNPRVRSTRDAVAVWIQAQLADPSLADCEAVVPILIEMFQKKLLTLLENDECA